MKTAVKQEFAIRRMSDAWYWCGKDQMTTAWCIDQDYAQRFGSQVEADIVGGRDIPDIDGAWGVVPLEAVA
jgi:hypothetical protein